MRCYEAGQVKGKRYRLDIQKRIYSPEGASPALYTLTGGGWQVKVFDNARVRLYSAREGFRLMGVKEEDFARIKDEFSYRQLMHFAGDSIVTTCLMGIFGELCGVDYERKIAEVSEAVQEKGQNAEAVNPERGGNRE